MHFLSVTESTISLRNTEVDSLQNSLKWLDELREFKANQQTAEIIKRKEHNWLSLEIFISKNKIFRNRYYNTIEVDVDMSSESLLRDPALNLGNDVLPARNTMSIFKSWGPQFTKTTAREYLPQIYFTGSLETISRAYTDANS